MIRRGIGQGKTNKTSRRSPCSSNLDSVPRCSTVTFAQRTNCKACMPRRAVDTFQLPTCRCYLICYFPSAPPRVRTDGRGSPQNLGVRWIPAATLARPCRYLHLCRGNIPLTFDLDKVRACLAAATVEDKRATVGDDEKM